MVKEIDTNCADVIICPYCGYEFTDSWELGNGGNVECLGCGKVFSFSAHVTVDYYSERDCALNQEKHEWQLDRELKKSHHGTLQEM